MQIIPKRGLFLPANSPGDTADNFQIAKFFMQMGMTWSAVMIVNCIPFGGKVEARSSLVKDEIAPVADR
jgi:hypothetical protein